MSTDNSLLLNRVFTRSTIHEMINDRYSETYLTAIQRYVNDFTDKDNRQLISEIYTVLNDEYRNEYYYKNTILNKLLLGVHKPTTTTALTEIAIGKAKADFVLINGQAVVYEIKTELDNLERLESQITNYFKAFTRVSVLTCEEHFSVMQKRLIGTPVGICILTKKGTIKVMKKPLENFSNVNMDTIFRILRKQEYEEIIKLHFGNLPNASQFEYYKKCKKLFFQIDKSIAYNDFLSILKKRGRINVEMFSRIPYELKFLVYFSNLKDSDYKKLEAFLHRKEMHLCTSLT